MKTQISLARLRQLLSYDPATGIFTTNVPRKRSYIGAPVGSRRPRGDLIIYLDGTQYMAHQLAWLYEYGEWPTGALDHINRNPSDNRIENLRPATLAENNRNTAIRKNNTHGYKGVVFAKHVSKWRARIRHNGRIQELGYYYTPEEACAAYEGAARIVHGEFYCNTTRDPRRSQQAPAPTKSLSTQSARPAT